MKIQSRRLRIIVAAWIGISFPLFPFQTPIVAAQNASGYQTQYNSANGLYVTTFITPSGSITVNLPDDMAAGDTISGTVIPDASGKNDAERARNLTELVGYVVEIIGLRTLVLDGTFTRNIPATVTNEAKIIALFYHGKRVAAGTIPISQTAPPVPTQFIVPTGGQQGRLIQLKGPRDGVFSPQDVVTIAGRVIAPLAESPRSLVLRNTSEVTGPTTLEWRDHGAASQCPFRNIGVNLSAPRLNLLRGETTTLHVVVLGLGGLAADQTLDLDNDSPTVITMSGGDRQHIPVHSSQIGGDGTYSTDRTLTGIMAGGFGVTATFRWTEVCNPSSSGPVAGQGSPRTSLDQGRSLLAHFKFYRALAPLTEALNSYSKTGDGNGAGVTSDALGDLYVQEGQYATALRYFQSARQAFVANKETLNASLVLSKIGETHLLMDDNAAAKAAFAQFGPQAQNSPTTTDVDRHKAFFGYARNKLGEGRADYLLGQLNTADADFKDLLAAASSSQNFRYEEAARFRVAAATSLGDVSFRKGDLAAARDRYNEALQIAQRDNRSELEWAAKFGLARTLWELARRSQTSGLQTRRAVYAAHAIGQTQQKLQTDALTAYKEALAEIATIMEGSIRAHEARTTFLSTTTQVFDEAAVANAEVSIDTKGADPTAARLIAEGFRIAEEGRARSLLDVLADGHAEISAGVPPELVKRRSENLANQQLIAAQLMGVSLAGETPKQAFSELEAELERLALEFETIENQIKSSSPRFASLIHTRSLTVDDVQRQVLDDETALLEYSLGDNSSYLWVITRQGASLFKLPPASTINQLAMDFRSQLIPPKLQRRNAGIDVPADDQQRGLGLGTEVPSQNTAAFARASNAVYKAAVAPAASVIGGRRLLIVADGALNFVPFEALVTSDRSGDYASLDYLVKTNNVSYAPSASLAAAMRDQKRSAGRNILLVADPIFSASDSRLQAGSAGAGARAEATRGLGLDSAVSDASGAGTGGTGPSALPRLAGTRIEAEQISRLAKASGAQSELWLDLNANENDVRAHEIQSYRVLHLATHGVLDAMRPQFSGLVLSLVGNKNDDDGFLRTNEVFNLKLGAPLVMLSACESGLGKVTRGEGVTGLTRAFMYAGAPTVGVTLWSVADKPTAELMTNFYQQFLGPNPSPSSAMREAQLSMISGKKYSAPFYWAPFVLVGEWK